MDLVERYIRDRGLPEEAAPILRRHLSVIRPPEFPGMGVGPEEAEKRRQEVEQDPNPRGSTVPLVGESSIAAPAGIGVAGARAGMPALAAISRAGRSVLPSAAAEFLGGKTAQTVGESDLPEPYRTGIATTAPFLVDLVTPGPGGAARRAPEDALTRARRLGLEKRIRVADEDPDADLETLAERLTREGQAMRVGEEDISGDELREMGRAVLGRKPRGVERPEAPKETSPREPEVQTPAPRAEPARPDKQEFTDLLQRQNEQDLDEVLKLRPRSKKIRDKKGAADAALRKLRREKIQPGDTVMTQKGEGRVAGWVPVRGMRPKLPEERLRTVEGDSVYEATGRTPGNLYVEIGGKKQVFPARKVVRLKDMAGAGGAAALGAARGAEAEEADPLERTAEVARQRVDSPMREAVGRGLMHRELQKTPIGRSISRGAGQPEARPVSPPLDRMERLIMLDEEMGSRRQESLRPDPADVRRSDLLRSLMTEEVGKRADFPLEAIEKILGLSGGPNR